MNEKHEEIENKFAKLLSELKLLREEADVQVGSGVRLRQLEERLAEMEKNQGEAKQYFLNILAQDID